MPRIIVQPSSSGTGPIEITVGWPTQEAVVKVGLWNTADVWFVEPTPSDASRQSRRPLSAIADMAADLGPVDLSTRYRAR